MDLDSGQFRLFENLDGQLIEVLNGEKSNFAMFLMVKNQILKNVSFFDSLNSSVHLRSFPSLMQLIFRGTLSQDTE